VVAKSGEFCGFWVGTTVAWFRAENHKLFLRLVRHDHASRGTLIFLKFARN